MLGSGLPLHTVVVVVAVVTVVTVVVLVVTTQALQRIGHLFRVDPPRKGCSQSSRAASLHRAWSAFPLHNALAVGVISTVVGVVEVVVESVVVVVVVTIAGAGVGLISVGAAVGTAVGGAVLSNPDPCAPDP